MLSPSESPNGPPGSRLGTATSPDGLAPANGSPAGARVAVVHDYLTQRGGAERVVLTMLKAFPQAPLHTALYDPSTTYEGFASAPLKTLPINRVRAFRRNHRLALPALAPSFSRHVVDADVVLCSSSGWAHGVQTQGSKVVYCYTPARWLYDSQRYAEGWPLAGTAVRCLKPNLVRWDRRSAATAQRYLTLSTAVQARIRQVYGIDAEVLPPPVTIDAGAAREPVAGVEPGYFLCVSRLLPYKNVGNVIAAFRHLPHRLVIAGSGPELARLRQSQPPNVEFVGVVSDEQLRWLYANCNGVVAAGNEDFGLAPVEAAAFGKPSAALAWGGFLDTVTEGDTGVFFTDLDPASIASAVRNLSQHGWDQQVLKRHAARFNEAAFITRLRQVVGEAVDQKDVRHL